MDYDAVYYQKYRFGGLSDRSFFFQERGGQGNSLKSYSDYTDIFSLNLKAI